MPIYLFKVNDFDRLHSRKEVSDSLIPKHRLTILKIYM